MFTIDYESVNGGIYRSREQAGTLAEAHQLVREGLRGLDCYCQAWIADATTGRRVQRGVRGHRGGWTFLPVGGITREELEAALVRVMGSEDAGTAMRLVDEHGEYPYTRTDAYGPLKWRARRYNDSTYALDKIPAPAGVRP